MNSYTLKHLEELEAEVQAIRGEVRKPAGLRAQVHQARVREAELRDAEYKHDKEWEVVPEKEDLGEWEVVSFAATKFDWDR